MSIRNVNIGQAKEAYDKSFYAPKWDHQAPTVDGFWSVTVYNQERFMVPNKYNSYSLNSLTAKKNADGTTTLHLGGDPKADNYLYIPEGWLYIVRFYQPHQEILDGKWTMPAAIEVK